MIICELISNTWVRGTAFYLELQSSFYLATAAFVIASSIVISVVALQSLAVYRQKMILARKGRLDWGCNRALADVHVAA